MEVRSTKIVCSIGPASTERHLLRSLIKAGMNVARINFSHGTDQDHRNSIREVRKVACDLGVVVGVLADLGGPKVRVLSPATLWQDGESFRVVADSTSGDVTLSSPDSLAALRVGAELTFADGTVRTRVSERHDDVVVVNVTRGGVIKQGAGVNFPDTILPTSAVTEKDRLDLALSLEEHVDFVALSFVSTAQDIRDLRSLFGLWKPLVIAKIERKAALTHLQEIIAVTDGVMVARGDLGAEERVERIPLLQKEIIRLSNGLGKPVITATQVLESMITSPTPTRAEATDIANAILDGTDALMLSAESAVGQYPVQATEVMSRISSETEAHAHDAGQVVIDHARPEAKTVAQSIAVAAESVANHPAVRMIVAVTESGETARLLAQQRPRVPILAATPSENTARSLTLCAGVIPLVIAHSSSTEMMIESSLREASRAGYLELGDLVVVVAGIPFGVQGSTNLVKVQTVGEGFLRVGDPA